MCLSTIIFSLRNFGKVNRGETGRIGAASLQAIKSCSETTELIFNSVDKLDKVSQAASTTGKVASAAGKVTKFTSYAINPLLCAASGIRVLKDEDKPSALVEEICAMGAMFGGEAAYKKLRRTVLESAGIEKELLGKMGIKNTTEGVIHKTSEALKENSAIYQKFGTCVNNGAKKIGESLKNFASKSKGKQLAIILAADAALVGVSILFFGAGKKIGQKITGRDKKTTKQETNAKELQTETVKISSNNPFAAQSANA